MSCTTEYSNLYRTCASHMYCTVCRRTFVFTLWKRYVRESGTPTPYNFHAMAVVTKFEKRVPNKKESVSRTEDRSENRRITSSQKVKIFFNFPSFDYADNMCSSFGIVFERPRLHRKLAILQSELPKSIRAIPVPPYR